MNYQHLKFCHMSGSKTSVVLIIKLKSKCTSTFYTVTMFFYAVPKHCHIKICMLFYPTGVGVYI